jgi:hypothetical protein
MKCKHVLAPYAQAVISGGGGSSISDLLPSQVSQYISLPSSTTLATVTITPPTGGTAPYSITSTLCQDASGSVISTSAPSGFVRTFSVSQGKSYLLTVELSDAAGQKTYSSYLVSIAKASALSWIAPASVSVSSSTTSTLVTWNAASGGVLPYTYSASILAFDSTGAGTATLSDAGLNTTISGLSSGTFLLERTVTDATGSSVKVQAAVVVAATISSITAGNGPSNQVLPSGTTSVSIGSWLAPTGGTGPYTYALTEPTGNGAVIFGSGLGPYGATGLTDGRTYGFLLTITDSLGAKGYSVITVSVAYAVPVWSIVSDINFTDGNWTPLNSTDVTASSIATQHILYASDGITPRAQVWNNTAQARRLQIDGTSAGLALITTSTAASPSIKVVPVNASGQNIFQTLNWNLDLIKVELLMEGSEPLGSGAFVHLTAFSSQMLNGTVQHGQRVTNSGSNCLIQRRSWLGADNLITDTSVAPGGSRTYQSQYEWYVTGSRTVESYARHGSLAAPLTDLAAIPRSGKYFMQEAVSQTLTQTPALQAFNTTATGSQWGFLLYVDGSFVDNGVSLSRLTLKRIRVSRLPNGSKA